MKKRYRSEFKKKVYLEAIEGKERISSLSSKYGIHSEVIKVGNRNCIKP